MSGILPDKIRDQQGHVVKVAIFESLKTFFSTIFVSNYMSQIHTAGGG